MSRNRFPVIVVTLLNVLVAPLGAQRAPAVRDLGAVTATTTEFMSLYLGLWHFSDGSVLINDGGTRRLLLFDSTLTKTTVVADTSRAALFPYGRQSVRLVPYGGDSVLFPDLTSSTLLLIGPRGVVVRTMAPPKTADLLRGIGSSAAGIDPRGRILYRGLLPLPPQIPGGPPRVFIDSAPVVRGDFDARRVDTVGMLRAAPYRPRGQIRNAEGKVSFRETQRPLPIVDGWALHADGTVAIVRGQDYHIDWITPDGVRTSTPRMPFDWRRLTIEDKQRLIDSLRTAYDTLPMPNRSFTLPEAIAQNVSRDDLLIVKDAAGREYVPIVYDYVSPDSIPDYYPPIRQVNADLDGNIWILPTTSAQSRKGGLVYDVVNRKGELYERVELPPGRGLAGFGKGGIVYLLSGDRTKGLTIERARFK